MSLMIRPVDLKQDRAHLIAYARDLFAISFANPTQFNDQFGSDGTAYISWIAEKQASGPANACLIFFNGEHAGMVVVGPWPEDEEVGYVYHYYLEPRFRGLGLAADMDAHAVQTLLRGGYSIARLSVAETNTRARRFYLRQNWSPVGPRPDQPGILYMSRTLPRHSVCKSEVFPQPG